MLARHAELFVRYPLRVLRSALRSVLFYAKFFDSCDGPSREGGTTCNLQIAWDPIQNPRVALVNFFLQLANKAQ